VLRFIRISGIHEYYSIQRSVVPRTEKVYWGGGIGMENLDAHQARNHDGADRRAVYV
jgi:hypothetical protein